MSSDLARYTLTTEQLAKILQYHPNYVRQLASKKRIPGLKCGGRWLFDPNEVYRFFESEMKKHESTGGPSVSALI